MTVSLRCRLSTGSSTTASTNKRLMIRGWCRDFMRLSWIISRCRRQWPRRWLWVWNYYTPQNNYVTFNKSDSLLELTTTLYIIWTAILYIKCNLELKIINGLMVLYYQTHRLICAEWQVVRVVLALVYLFELCYWVFL